MMVQVVILGGSGKESSCVEPCPTKCIEAPASTLPWGEQPSSGDSDADADAGRDADGSPTGKESNRVERLEPCPTTCRNIAPASTLPGAEQPSGGDSDSLTPILVVRLIVGSGSFPLGKKQPC